MIQVGLASEDGWATDRACSAALKVPGTGREQRDMRLQLGDIPRVEGPSPEAEDWRVIRSPAVKAGYWLAALVGLALLGGLCVGLGMWSWAVGERGGMATASDSANSWAAVLIVLVVFVPLHELLHLLGQPEWGRSNRSIVAVWPAKLQFGVYYEGCMSRWRWLGMRLAPLIVLSVLPACVLALLQLKPQSVELELGLQVLLVVNAPGSGGDVVAALLVVSSSADCPPVFSGGESVLAARLTPRWCDSFA